AQAAGGALARRPRPGGVRRRRGGLGHEGARARRPARARRRPQDRRRRQRRPGDPRLPRGEAARMSVLVFLEQHGNELQKGSLGVLTKAASLGDGDVAAVIVGENAKTLASEAGKFGAAKVFVAEDTALQQALPQTRVDVLAQV